MNTPVALCLAGFLLHFLGRYGEFLRTQATRIGPHTYVAQDWPGWLSAMIPEEYGGPGLGLAEATVILEEVNHCGGNSGTVHGQMYNMFTL